jgi:hypothetical protein
MRRIAALAMSAVLWGGCTLLAGLDGNYVVGDGEPDAGSPCEPGQARACYSGPAGTEGVGVCKAGTQVCNEDGTAYGPCEGEVTPGSEDCVTTDDEDCDGETLDAEDGCACVPMTAASCYSGPAETEGTGACKAGLHACNELGTGYGPCVGEVLPKVEVCASPEDENCNGEAACTGTHLWSKRFGDTDDQYGLSVTTDSAGNVLLTGYFRGTVDFGGGALTSAGGYDLFVAKLDPAGAHLWSKRSGDANSQVAFSITTDSVGNVLLTGTFGGTIDFGGGALTSAGGDDLFVAKLDAAGKQLWSKRFGDANEQYGYSITTDSAGNVLLTGYFGGTIDFEGGALTSAGGNDLFVAKFDAAGAHLWSKHFGDAEDQYGLSITTDSAGNVLLTGRFFGTVDFGGGALTSAGGGDLFVAKLAP